VRALKAFLLGFVAVGLVLYVFAAAIALAVAAGGGTLLLALGPLIVLEVARSGNGTVTSFGGGLVVLALLAGVVNAVAADVIRRRTATPHGGGAPFA
jgi:hypothetical protein